MYYVKEISNHEEWESFYATTEYTPFVQSALYGNFYESMGEKSWIIGVYDDKKLIGGTLVVSTSARRGKFLYIPYGPVLPFDDAHAYEMLFRYIRKLAQTEGCAFVRVSPFIDDTPDTRERFRALGFRKAPIHVLAETTWMLEITPDADTLLKNMKKNHRNLIRRCERDGVTIKIGTDQKMLDELDTLLDVTAKRHDFVRFSQSYIEKEFKTLADAGNAFICNAYLPDGSLNASAIIMVYGNMGVYRHSASLPEPKRLPTSYLIQWSVIQKLKEMGITWYNFWGVAPEGAHKNHPFFGITHFKKGFGGIQKDVLPAHDMPITTRYWITWCIESFRRIRRGF